MTYGDKEWGDEVCRMVLQVLKHIRGSGPAAPGSLESTGIRVDEDVRDAVYKRSA